MGDRGATDEDEEIYGKFKAELQETYIDAENNAKNIEKKKDLKWATLHRSAVKGLTSDIELILSNDDYNINCTTGTYNETPLFLAAQNNHLDSVEKLLEKNASPTIANSKGWTPLHIASFNGNVEIVSELLKNNEIKIDATANNGATSLHVASCRGHFKVVQMLMSEGCNVNLATNNGSMTALHLATKADNNEIVTLLAKRSYIDNQDSTGLTPLHLACANGNLEIVKFLVNSAKARTNVTNKSGKKPIDLAKANNHDSVVSFLNVVINEEPINCNLPRKATVQIDNDKKFNDDFHDVKLAPAENEEHEKPSAYDHFLKCICCCFCKKK